MGGHWHDARAVPRLLCDGLSCCFVRLRGPWTVHVHRTDHFGSRSNRIRSAISCTEKCTQTSRRALQLAAPLTVVSDRYLHRARRPPVPSNPPFEFVSAR